MLGHLWTIAPRVRSALHPVRAAPDEAWSVAVPDDRWGTVRVTGRLREAPGATAVVVVVHGLGGCTESHYIAPAANACADAGLSCLRLNLRGSDRSGEDLYHAGLTADLAAAVARRGPATLARLRSDRPALRDGAPRPPSAGRRRRLLAASARRGPTGDRPAPGVALPRVSDGPVAGPLPADRGPPGSRPRAGGVGADSDHLRVGPSRRGATIRVRGPGGLL